MTRFAFIVHPIAARDVARKYKIARYMPDAAIEAMIRRRRPSVVSEIRGVVSKTGATAEGLFVGLPLTARQIDRLVPIEEVYDRIVACCELAEREGAKLIGLGAFSSVVGDGGITVAGRTSIAVTTGNSYTVATAIEGTRRACDMLGLDRSDSTLAVVGAAGSIGRTCAKVLAPDFKRTILIGRDPERTAQAAAEVARAEVRHDVNALREADAVVTVTSSDAPVILPEHIKPGAVVCDVARPRDVSTRVARERQDVLVIEGGVVKVPGPVDFGFDFGFPPGTAYACMSETMLLALEDRAENFTLGKTVSVEQVQEMLRLAEKHGFELAGFRSFERPVSAESIERARAARRAPIGV